MIALLLFATTAVADDCEEFAEKYARGMAGVRSAASADTILAAAPDDEEFFEENADDGDVVMLRIHHSTVRFRIAEYKDRWTRAETDRALGVRRLFSNKPPAPRWGRSLQDDIRWRIHDREDNLGWSGVVALGQSNTGLRFGEVPGFKNETSEFGRAALSYRW